MAQTARKPMALTGEQAAELLKVVRSSDSIELKVTVPETDQGSTLRALEVDPLKAQIRQIFFFDTPDLALSKSGVVVRARRIQGDDHDSVVKLRPVVPEQLPKDLRKDPGFKVEVDVVRGGYVCSGSLSSVLDGDVIRDTTQGGKPLRKLYSKKQREYYADHAPEGIELDDLSVLGPIFVLKLKMSPKTFSHRLDAEMWLYPDGSRMLELSTKCLPGEGLALAEEAKAFLAEKGIEISSQGETKTSRAMKYFSTRLTQEAPTK